MLLEVDNSTTHIEITPTFSSLDESLHLIKRYLMKQLSTQEEAWRLSPQAPVVVVDLGLLGISDFGKAAEVTPSWKDKITYPIRLYRSQVVLGPLFIPSQAASPCPHCLERRWFGNRPKAAQVAVMHAQQALISGHNPKVTPFALESIWNVIASTVFQPANILLSPHETYPFYVLNLESLQVAQYHLIQDPLCPICTTPILDTPEAAELQLSSRPKHHPSSYRLVKATDYDLPLAGLINPVSGVLGPAELPDRYNALAAPVNGTFRVRNHFSAYDVTWGGHGNSYHESKALGILEGFERYVGHIPRGKQSTVFDSYEHLAPDALDPRLCGLYQPAYYQKTFPVFQPFTPERNIPWVWGYSFRQTRPILVPEQLAYYLNYRSDSIHFVQDCSNGCAIGSCIEEAIFYGLLELIERDAFLLTWYTQLAPPRIDPRSCRRSETLFLLEALEKCGYELHLFDTRYDIQIPSVVGVATRKEPGLGYMQLTAGCSLDPEDAIRGALCELVCYIPSFRERVEKELETIQEMARDYSNVSQLSHHALLHGLPEMASRTAFLFQNQTFRSVEDTYRHWLETSPRNHDLRDDVLYCINTILQLGMDVIVVDQTSPELLSSGLRTACVIVPGLLPIDFGWGKDRVFDLPRLRTVPRTAGFRDTDFEPDVSDVIPHPFP